MLPVSQAVLLSWSVPPAASLALALTGAIYLRGWFLMRVARVPFVPAWRAVSFLLGLLTLWIALASPLDTFSSFLITAHMLQHMLLMMFAPPLLLLGAPLIPLVCGLPVFAAREFAGPFLNWHLRIRLGRALTNLFVAVTLMGVVMFAWHTPRLYELALASSSWHEFEHACFFGASLIFWWPVVQPWPSHAQSPRWAVVPYLMIGDLQNTVLSAILVFSDRVLYPSYARMPRLFGFSALKDQAASGAIMWVVGSLAFLVPAVVIAMQCLAGRTPLPESQPLPKPYASWLSRRAQSIAFGYEWLRRRVGPSRVEAFTFILLFAVAGLSLAALASRSSDDDDQALRMRETSGKLAIAVFAAPGELEAGRNSFAVLVQDAKTHEVLQDAAIDLHAKRDDRGAETKTVRAGTEDSENKLLQSADLDLPDEGRWSLTITAQEGADSAEFTLPLEVIKPDAGFHLSWAYIAFLLFAALLAVAYVRRHSAMGSAARHNSPATSRAEGYAADLELRRQDSVNRSRLID